MLQIFHSTNHTIPKKYHIIFWLGYFGFNVLRWGSYFGDYWYSFKSNLVEFPLHMLLVYLNIYWLMPRFVLRRKYKRYILFLLSALLLVYCLRTGLNYLLVDKNIWPEAAFPQRAFSFNHIVAVSLGELYVLALATTLKLTVDWIRERTRVEDLRKIQKKTELDFLRSQIQPHFFFNTLNNLYALTLEKSALAPSVVLKLSDMMQYVLYDVKTPAIRLYEEINHLQNYLDLERLRFGEKVEVNTEIIGNIDNLKVPPLLFLPFVENCF
ncbi:MAG: histidine kinase, partial [Lutibacter sp.]|nr:histidine kinase [Lutibacter sp.]